VRAYPTGRRARDRQAGRRRASLDRLRTCRLVGKRAELRERHPRLNLLNLEATARVLGATVLLSTEAASGVLPGVLDAEALVWITVDAT